jgi:hypothetical protein
MFSEMKSNNHNISASMGAATPVTTGVDKGWRKYFSLSGKSHSYSKK